MKKKGKKILISLAATMLLSTSVGQAASINYEDNTYYTPYSGKYNKKGYVITYNNYSNNYLQNRYSNIIIRWTPKYWDDNNTNVPIKPETPIKDVETPESDIDKGKDKTNNTPETKPSNPIPEVEEESNTSIEMEVVRLVNIERQKAGLTPLTYSEELSKVARAKSQDMSNKNYFSHTSPTYGDPFSMMRSFGIQYKTAGENIAKGYSSAKSVVNGWMNSSGHRANILNPSFGTIGVGYVKANGTTYWTQMFTN
ncbi:SCP-like protein [[Clostridium] ultunense Esp]|uniref:SCP-like protein n=1 Tax=[Clostridium] ultunense Esp TaxID=1288971 RepID=M1ZBH1_9FIRM|nr:CAP domain-containing protein [Schnuerera ultunensis]CCQ95148.1 SCP-like protein [[Clostridium] ultunense Esp]SHD78418.1 SCP-like protein [[Clostridium] ultunense Esp]